MTRERPIIFEHSDETLVGIIHGSAAESQFGVVIIVGGPQYRVGSHRQFVLLARALAEAGFPVLRFDYRGIGDSSGASRSFEGIDTDIRRAIDEFEKQSGVKEVVLWGLCDAASAALIYAPGDSRVVGLIMLNPWVHAERSEARVRLTRYYGARLRNPAFWRKLMTFDLDIRDSIVSLYTYVHRAFAPVAASGVNPVIDYIERMRLGLTRYCGKVFIILSGNDLTADEFRQISTEQDPWRKLLAQRVDAVLEMPEANHTFARSDWRAQVEKQTIAWCRAIFRGGG